MLRSGLARMVRVGDPGFGLPGHSTPSRSEPPALSWRLFAVPEDPESIDPVDGSLEIVLVVHLNRLKACSRYKWMPLHNNF